MSQKNTKDELLKNKMLEKENHRQRRIVKLKKKKEKINANIEKRHP